MIEHHEIVFTEVPVFCEEKLSHINMQMQFLKRRKRCALPRRPTCLIRALVWTLGVGSSLLFNNTKCFLPSKSPADIDPSCFGFAFICARSNCIIGKNVKKKCSFSEANNHEILFSAFPWIALWSFQYSIGTLPSTINHPLSNALIDVHSFHCLVVMQHMTILYRDNTFVIRVWPSGNSG